MFGDLDYDIQDFIRPKIWSDNRIPYWYKQNILFFSKRQTSKDATLNSADIDVSAMPLDLVHPDLYLGKAISRIGVRSSFRLFRRSLKDYISRKIGRDS